MKKSSNFSENLFPAYAGTTHRVTQLPPLDPTTGELGEEEREGRLPRRGGWWRERPPAAGVVAGGGGL